MNPNSTPQQSRSAGSPDTPNETQRRGMDKVADPKTDAAGRGTGLPAQAPHQELTPTDSPWTPKEASIQSSMRLPHERDEDTPMTDAGGSHAQVSPQIHHALEDLAAGHKDTSRSNEMDQAYHRLHESSAGAPSPQPRRKGDGEVPS